MKQVTACACFPPLPRRLQGIDRRPILLYHRSWQHADEMRLTLSSILLCVIQKEASLP
jgi:hypothetical protein